LASGDAHMKLHVNLTANRRISNPPEAEMMKYGIASGFAFGYDPTGRSVIY
jgi:hypothetical protein